MPLSKPESKGCDKPKVGHKAKPHTAGRDNGPKAFFHALHSLANGWINVFPRPQNALS
ncbi:MAG: hypothetical protein RLZZ476_2151 [Verrucomicrobiota bacterium]|jgi:hypothetical protein